MCDARPAVVGHVLVVSTAHIPSAIDLTEPAYTHLRLVQQEISWRVKRQFGEVGVYEHGRSMICRFHDVNRGHVHAHLHVVPASFDLIQLSGYDVLWTRQPSSQEITENDRYLYQEIGERPCESWAIGRLPVRRHFVRAQLQDVLRERQRPWIPLESSPDDHDEAVSTTASELRDVEAVQTSNKIFLLGSVDQHSKAEIAAALQFKDPTGKLVIASNEPQHPNEVGLKLRLSLTTEDSPRPSTPSVEKEQRETENARPLSTNIANWDEFRFSISKLSLDQIVTLITTAWRLRFNEDLF